MAQRRQPDEDRFERPFHDGDVVDPPRKLFSAEGEKAEAEDRKGKTGDQQVDEIELARPPPDPHRRLEGPTRLEAAGIGHSRGDARHQDEPFGGIGEAEIA